MEIEINTTKVDNSISSSSTGVEILVGETNVTVNESTVLVDISVPIQQSTVNTTTVSAQVNANTAENLIIGIPGVDGQDGGVQTVTGTAVDNTDPTNPIVNIPTAGQLTYIFSSVNSDISGYESMPSLNAYTVGALASITTSVTSSPTLMGSFATNLGFPNVTQIPVGEFLIHYDTQKALPAHTYTTWAEIYKRTSGGTETLIGTSDITSPTAVQTVVQQSVTAIITSAISMLSTDRVVVKIYGSVDTGSGDVALQYDDNTNARIEFPSAIVDATNFVPYTGATANVALGARNITASKLLTTTNIVDVGFGNSIVAGFGIGVGNTTTAIGSIGHLGFNNQGAGFSAGFGNNTGTDNNSFAVGGSNICSNSFTSAIGKQSTASGFFATVIGYLCTASGFLATALGFNAKATNTNTFAVGRNVTASASGSAVIGSHSTELINSTADSLMVGYEGNNLLMTAQKTVSNKALIAPTLSTNNSSTLGYSGENLSSVTYANGTAKAITYNGDGSVNTVTTTFLDASTLTKTLGYSGGNLTSITVI